MDSTRIENGTANGHLSSESVSLIKRKPEKASKGRRIALLLASFFQQVIANGVGFGLGIMYGELVRVFDANRSDAALVQSLYMGFSNGAGICWSWLINRYGTGSCSIIGGLVSFIGIAVSSLATSLTSIILLTGLLSGIGMSAIYLSAFVTVGWVFHQDAGTPLVFMTIGSSVGQFVVPVLYELFISSYSWNGAFLLISGVVLQNIPIGIFLHTSRGVFIKGDDGLKVETKYKMLKQLWSLGKDVVVWLMLSNLFLISLSANIEVWFMVDILMTRGYERSQGSLLVSCMGFANMLGRMSGTLVKFTSRFPTYYHWIYLGVILAGLHGLVVYFTTYIDIFITCMVYGLAIGLTTSQSPSIMLELCGLERYPLAMALVSLMYGLGNFSGGFIGGFIKDMYGDYDVTFYVAIGASMYVSCTVVIIALVLRRRETHSDIKYIHFTNEQETSS